MQLVCGVARISARPNTKNRRPLWGGPAALGIGSARIGDQEPDNTGEAAPVQSVVQPGGPVENGDERVLTPQQQLYPRFPQLDQLEVVAEGDPGHCDYGTAPTPQFSTSPPPASSPERPAAPFRRAA